MSERLAAKAVAYNRVAASSQAMLVVDDDCVCAQASLGACRLLGLSRCEWWGAGSRRC